MKVEFRKSFEKDLAKIRDQDLLVKIKAVIEEVECNDGESIGHEAIATFQNMPFPARFMHLEESISNQVQNPALQPKQSMA